MRGRIEVDGDLAPVVIPAEVLNEVFAHAREAEPEECCGLITGDVRLRHRVVVRCRNDMTLHHRRDPGTYPRDGTEAFHMNEQDYLAAEREASTRGEDVTCVYHSHVGCGAYFSELDQEFAEQPHFPFPHADHLVVSVIGGKVGDPVLFERRRGEAPGRWRTGRRGASAGRDGLPGFVGRGVMHGRS
ncbi:MAG TPA: Mov34/MPN/PAD-1 family protein [Myxococcota bacterium]|nr:Mov34/MPN/PAD-1 family protein [Myxococcota bacterium]